MINIPLCRTDNNDNSKYLLSPQNVPDTVQRSVLFQPHNYSLSLVTLFFLVLQIRKQIK